MQCASCPCCILFKNISTGQRVMQSSYVTALVIAKGLLECRQHRLGRPGEVGIDRREHEEIVVVSRGARLLRVNSW